MSATYTPPTKDILFDMNELADLKAIAALPGYEDATPDLVESILEEAGKFSSRVLAPINFTGDQEGAVWKDGNVTTPRGFKEAYKQFVDAGWNGVNGDVEYGGQGLPKIIVAALNEMWKSANLSFSLAPLLTTGAVEALELCGSDALKHTYLPNMISGKWAGTMNLTEPQAGSDLALVRTKAIPQSDGTYKVTGQKIFITYGEHDLTENIIHLVLARTPTAPEGVKGISLFLVPKFMVNADGSLGERNDVRCVSIEHKLGIHASPTAVLAYGDNGGAVGYLVGEENRGLEYMFIMMNAARFSVGIEGIAMAERAYQKAAQYAKERVQGRDIGGGKESVAIINHPDVRRMLMLIRSQNEAMRSLAYVVAASSDLAAKHPDANERKKHQAFLDLMIPVVKGWSTETGIQCASLGVQVHGGMGFIEETGAAQFYCDARITTIYEGTTGIQANDLMWRKIIKDQGSALRVVMGDMQAFIGELGAMEGEQFAAMKKGFEMGVMALGEAAMHIATSVMKDPKGTSVGAAPLLELFGIVAGGWQLFRGAIAAQKKIDAGEADPFFKNKVITARFYADHVLAKSRGLAYTVKNGAPGAMAMGVEEF
ncbi:MAG TPA: acyl-CoA dehydrogenase C-terminal domain-containing protein [Thermoflexales bacterium]|nr:acyl-CoA dehydrogenase C-terminal domain-containing protein [Thermoflexales bacterium]